MSTIGPALQAALDRRGYTALTPVQEAVLAAGDGGRDLRISSQTGSGKTVAIGISLRDVVAREAPNEKGPRALVIVPTRELAKQVQEELSWLYEDLGARVASVTGGSSYRDEHRALSKEPEVVVGTPGRLLDHLDRGSIQGGSLRAVVLDEADRMLDMGFREELEAILAKLPTERRAHLVSATFPREVLYLANRLQKDPLQIQGTQLGAANADIEHVVHLVDGNQRIDAMVNMLLSFPGERALVFTKTRVGVSDVASALEGAGFGVVALSGEMEQNERNRAIAAFKRGTRRVLVATDVAARGIDVQDISQVIHAEITNDADAYTHRSGRTGRAGKKGRSVVLAAPRELMTVRRVLAKAGVPWKFEPVPSAAAVRELAGERLLADLTTDDGTLEIDDETRALAARLAQEADVEGLIARLLVQSGLTKGPEPRDIRPIAPPATPARGAPAAAGRRPAAMAMAEGRGRRFDRNERFDGPDQGGFEQRGAGPQRSFERPARTPFDDRRDAPWQQGDAPREHGRGPRPGPDARWVPFQVTWGELHGADPRRMLAMICRRGDVGSQDVGAIDVGRTSSLVQISEAAAERFLTAAGRPDPRDPRIAIRPAAGAADGPSTGRGGAGRGPGAEQESAPRRPAPGARNRFDREEPRFPRTVPPVAPPSPPARPRATPSGRGTTQGTSSQADEAPTRPVRTPRTLARPEAPPAKRSAPRGPAPRGPAPGGKPKRK